MENEDGSDIGELRRKRITISGGRYLIFYTFTNSHDETGPKSDDSKEPRPNEQLEK